MNRFLTRLLLTLLLCSLPLTAAAEFSFDLMVDDLNVSARSDMQQFRMQVADQFAVSVGTVDRLVARLGSPGDAYLALQVGSVSGASLDRVVQTRQQTAGQGWGKTAQLLGIKPGSAEFHRLKQKPGKAAKAKKAKKHKGNNKKDK